MLLMLLLISLCVSCSFSVLVIVSPSIKRSISICVVPSALLLISSRTIAFPLVFSQYAFGSACGSTRSA